MAALCCYRPGQASRLIYRPRSHLLLKDARKSFSWKDYRDLLVRAHIQLDDGPIVVVFTAAEGNGQHRVRHTQRPRVRTLRRELRKVPIRPHLVDGCLITNSLPSHHRPHPETSVATTSVAEGHDAGTHGQGSPANHSCFAARAPAVQLRGILGRVA